MEGRIAVCKVCIETNVEIDRGLKKLYLSTSDRREIENKSRLPL